MSASLAMRRFDPRLRLIYITDPELPEPRQAALVEELLEAGVRAIQLRRPGSQASDLYAEAVDLRARTEARGALLIVNERLDVALAAGADGCHLGRRSMPIAAARSLSGSDFLLGYSAHSLDEVQRVGAAGVDYSSLSPIFPPKSKESSLPSLGLDRLKQIATLSAVPLIALGGIVPLAVGPCVEAGAAGVAMIGALSRADEPVIVVQKVLKAYSNWSDNQSG